MDLDDIRKAVIKDVAEQVVAKLPEEDKAELVKAAMAKVVSNYEFISEIEKKLKARGVAWLNGMMTEPEFDALLCKKFQAGVDLFMEALPKVVAAAMVGTLIGPSDYKAGAVFKGLCDVLGLDQDQLRSR